MRAFTLAEVLITLAIIGIVAALTIPSVISSFKDKQYNTARLKALKTFGEAGKMAPINDEMNSQENAEDFVNNVLSKYLKITKVCDNDHSVDCGFPTQIQPLNPDSAKQNITSFYYLGNTVSKNGFGNGSVVVSTADGFSARIFYNSKCARDVREITTIKPCPYKVCPSYAIDQTCINVIYDMNGVKGPNHVGEDVGFVTVFWSGLSATATAPGLISYNEAKTIYEKGAKNFADALAECASAGNKKNLYSLPNINELLSIIVNGKLTYFTDYVYYWSGSAVADMSGYLYTSYKDGTRYRGGVTETLGVMCVRR